MRKVSNRQAAISLVILGCAGLLTIVLGVHFALQSRAAATALVGPDTSHHQASLDSAQAKSQGMAYHFMKVSQGLNFNDASFAAQRTKSVNAGLIVGGYHFLEAGNGAAQCDHYLAQLNAHGGTSNIMLALDVELQSSTTGPSYKDVTDFLARCQPKTPGRTWVLYTGAWYWGNSKQKGYLSNPKAPAGTVLWVSMYVSGTGSALSLLDKVTPQGAAGEPYAAAPINGWSDYAFRQYSSTATVANLSAIDANVTYKGLDYVRTLAGIAPPNPLPLPGQPDLVVTNISWAPTVPAGGGEVLFSATIKNQGTSATPTGKNIGVSFLVDGSQVSWSANGNTSLAAGASRTQTANGGPSNSATWAATAGAHNVVAYVDDLDLIDETDDTNNTTAKSLVIGQPDVVLGDINGDGRVNVIDLSPLLAHDHQNYPPADLNKDGVVGAADLAILLGNWTW